MFSIWQPIGDALSAVACSALVYLFWRRRTKIGHKLFPRQLLMLATSDLLYSAGDFIFALGTRPSLFACQLLFSVMWSANYVSCLLETHIALGLMCAYWRQLRALRALNHILVLSWPIGIALGVAQTFMSIGNVASGEFQGECGEVRNREAAYFMETSITLVFFAASLVAYGASVVRVWRYPESVQQEVWRMAWAYPCTFFVTWGPLIMYQLLRSSLHEQVGHVWVIFAISAKALNGFLNVVVYALSAHFAKTRSAALDMGNGLMAEEQQAVIKSHRGEGTDADNAQPLREFISFHVGFRATDSVVSLGRSGRTPDPTVSTMISTRSSGDSSAGQSPQEA